jgi:hypothetical protein
MIPIALGKKLFKDAKVRRKKIICRIFPFNSTAHLPYAMIKFFKNTSSEE